jgi:hypothetical protein
MTKIASLAERFQAKYAQMPSQIDTRPSFGPPPGQQAEIAKSNVIQNLDKAMSSLDSLASLYADYGDQKPFTSFDTVRKELERLLAHLRTVELETIYE